MKNNVSIEEINKVIEYLKNKLTQSNECQSSSDIMRPLKMGQSIAYKDAIDELKMLIK